MTKGLVLIIHMVLFDQVEGAFSAIDRFPAFLNLWIFIVVHFLISLVELTLITVHKLPFPLTIWFLQILIHFDIYAPIAQETFLAVFVQFS